MVLSALVLKEELPYDICRFIISLLYLETVFHGKPPQRNANEDTLENS